MKVDKLQKLLEVFEASEAGNLKVDEQIILFNLEVWSKRLPVDKAKKHGLSIQTHSTAGDCGMACCVAGTAGLIPEFQREGLITVWGGVEFGNKVDYEAFAQFFDLTVQQTRYICDPDCYNSDEFGTSLATPEMVCERLREVIASAN